MTADRAPAGPAPGRSLAGLTIAAVAALAVLLWLGFWQLERYEDKSRMLAGIAASAGQPPRDGQDKAEHYSRARLSGRFLPDSTVFVPDTLAESGFSPAGGAEGRLGVHVLAVLRLDNGAAILVDRGFVPTGPRGEPPPITTAPGPVSLTGFWRPPEGRHWFAIPDQPARRIFAVRDPATIGKALGLDIAAAAIFEVERQPGELREGVLPRGATAPEIIGRIPNNHLSYALTWFGLAATLAGVYLALVLHVRRERLSGPRPRL